MYDFKKLEWCKEYVKQLRDIEIAKFDQVCGHILDYMEQHTKMSKEEIEKAKENTKARGKGDATLKEKLILNEKTKDLMFGVWANVQGKSVMHQKISFGNYECALPMKQATTQLIFRCLWTSYDYVSAQKIQDDFVVGGVVSFQMFAYPEACLSSNSKCITSSLSFRMGNEERVAH